MQNIKVVCDPIKSKYLEQWWKWNLVIKCHNYCNIPSFFFFKSILGTSSMGDEEVKRFKNQEVTQKQRNKKLERITRLENRVDELKEQNCDLITTAQTLREQVEVLKQQVKDHIENGCVLKPTDKNN